MSQNKSQIINQKNFKSKSESNSDRTLENLKRDFILILKPEINLKDSIIQDEKRIKIILEILDQIFSEISYMGLLDESNSNDLKYIISDYLENQDMSSTVYSNLIYSNMNNSYESEEDFEDED